MCSVEAIKNKLFVRYPALKQQEPALIAAYDAMVHCYTHGGKLLICGNGGSAADAEHIVGELMKGFLSARTLSKEEQQLFADMEDAHYLTSHLQGALPAIALNTHTALSTAFSNDVAPDMVFAQQVYGYGNPNDLLMALSTSGNSSNVLRAIQVAKVRKMATIAITGQDGGKMVQLCDVCIRLPERETFCIQELTLPIYHALCAMVEARFFDL